MHVAPCLRRYIIIWQSASCLRNTRTNTAEVTSDTISHWAGEKNGNREQDFGDKIERSQNKWIKGINKRKQRGFPLQRCFVMQFLLSFAFRCSLWNYGSLLQRLKERLRIQLTWPGTFDALHCPLKSSHSHLSLCTQTIYNHLLIEASSRHWHTHLTSVYH